jgi:hypothetical protein
MAPKHKGLTRTDAVGDSKRYLPKALLGGGADGITLAAIFAELGGLDVGPTVGMEYESIVGNT